MNAVAEKVKHEFAVMDRTGDTKTIWDPENDDEVEIAKATFEKFKGKGYMIYRVGKNGEKSTQMNKFDASAEKMIAVPPVVGG